MERILVFSTAAILLVSGAACGHWRQPLSTYEVVVFGPQPSVDLSNELKRCSELTGLDTEHGRIEVRHPSAFRPEDAQRIAEDYGRFFQVAERLLGGGRVDMIVFVVMRAEQPSSYTIRTSRRGSEWRTRQLGFVVVSPEAPVGSEIYWKQISGDIHEMTHKYLDLWLAGCQHEVPAIRWFEDGTCELVQALFLEQRGELVDPALREARRPPSDPSLFAPTIFEWPMEPESLEYEVAVVEADRYRVAYHLLRYIHDVEGPDAVRALRDALLARVPRTLHQVDAVLRDVLGLDSSELVRRAQEHMNRSDHAVSRQRGLKE